MIVEIHSLTLIKAKLNYARIAQLNRDRAKKANRKYTNFHFLFHEALIRLDIGDAVSYYFTMIYKCIIMLYNLIIYVIKSNNDKVHQMHSDQNKSIFYWNGYLY